LRLQATVTRTVVTFAGTLQRTPSGAVVQAVAETFRVEDAHTGIELDGGYRLVYRWSETHAYFGARATLNLAGAPDVSSLILGTGTLSSSSAGVTATLRVDLTLVSPLGVDESTSFTQVDVTLNAPPTVQMATIDSRSGTAGAT
jgi:hypothetical protein